MKIFVTGASSFIGRELIKQCDEQGIEVSGNDLAASDSPRFFAGDIRDASMAAQIPEGIDALVHLAALSRDADCKNNAYSCFDANVMGTLNLMEAAQKRGVKQFIFASTEWVYDRFDDNEPFKTEDSIINIANITSEYALSKLVSETNLRQKYMQGFCPVTILRFGIVYGPRKDNWAAVESIFNSVATRDELAVGSLKTARHFIHVSDIASAIIKAVGLEGFEILNIQGDRLITLGDVIETSMKIMGRTLTIKESSPNKPSVRRVSNKKAKNLLGWGPVIDLEKGLQTIRSFLA